MSSSGVCGQAASWAASAGSRLHVEKEGQIERRRQGRDQLDQPRDRAPHPSGAAAAGEDRVETRTIRIDDGAQVIALAARIRGVGGAKVVGIQRHQGAVRVQAAQQNQGPPPVVLRQRRAALGLEGRVQAASETGTRAAAVLDCPRASFPASEERVSSPAGWMMAGQVPAVLAQWGGPPERAGAGG